MYMHYDMDNTAGIQWFGEWTDQDIYSWTTENDRALYTRLLEVESYRDRFMVHPLVDGCLLHRRLGRSAWNMVG